MSAGVQTDAARVLALAVAGLQASAADADRAVGSIDSTTVAEAVEGLRALREAIGVLRQCEAGIERWIAVCFREEGWRDPVELPGCGIVEVRRSTTRRAWDHELVRRDWVNAWLNKWAEESNEGPDVYDAIDACMAIASLSGYKVTWMRQLGLDPEDYCESLPGTPRVVLS